MTGLIARNCTACNAREVVTDVTSPCAMCGAPYGPLRLGLDYLLNNRETEAPAWPIGSRISSVIRRACGLPGKAP